MNFPLLTHEMAVVCLALGVLLIDLWTPTVHKHRLGCVAAGGVLAILVWSAWTHGLGAPDDGAVRPVQFGFGKMYVEDGLALFFKQFFLLSAFLVLLLAGAFASRIAAGIGEYYAVILFALTGMLFAASANDFILVFVSLELITVSFYILVSFQRSRLASLEAGVKYLILGGLSSGFLVFGVALVFGTANTTNFAELQGVAGIADKPVFLLGLLLVFVGLGFKIAAFPFQIWAPDVYEGAPVPTTAFLAVGSKAAGFALLLRMLFSAVPEVSIHWSKLLMAVAGITILYGNLCAIPQRSLKRLLGYSSIAQAGYLMLGVAALNLVGVSAVLYYLAGYLFSVLGAFTVITLIMRETDSDDIAVLAGLSQRSPLLAATLALSMISLAGIPPLAGFFGKFLVLKAVIEQGAANSGYYTLAWVAITGVVISLYYYFGVIRAAYWSSEAADLSAIELSAGPRLVLVICLAGMVFLGVYPNPGVDEANQAAKGLSFKPRIGLAHVTRTP